MTAVTFVSFFLLFCLPGLPLGLWLCGKDIKRHPEAVIYGLLLGHFLSSGLVVGLVYLFGFSLLALGLAVALAAGWFVVSLKHVGGPSSGRLPFKTWDRRTYALFLLLLLITAALLFEPFSNLGRETATGYAYRKYFIGDFLKEVAVTAELSKGEIPPRNPWFAGEPLHYYWWYFVSPASFYRLTGRGAPLETLLVLATALTDVLFLFMLYSTLRLFTSRELAPFLAVLLGVAAYSYEGMYLWWKLQEPFTGFLEHARGYNVDGLTRWLWGEPQMDGFFRSLLYTPQHLHALTLLLAILSISTLGNVPGSLSLSAITGLMVGASVGYSVFVGLVIALWYGLHLGIRVLSSKSLTTSLPPFLVSGSLAGVLVLLFYTLQMFVGDPDAGLMLHTGKAFRSHGPLVFLMNFGPPCIFGLSGILLWKRRPDTPAPLLSLLLLLLLAVTLIATVAVKGFLSDVGLKLGLVVLTILLVFTAIFLEFMHRTLPRPASYLIVALVGGPALLTVLVDRSNTSDIANASFTLYVSKEDAHAATWIKTHLPDRAIVQSSSPDLRVDFFSLIPILGERRTAVGDSFYARIFQIPQVAVDRRKGDIARLFGTDDPAETMSILRKYRIDYIYVGGPERASYPLGIRKFYAFPDVFEKVYGNPRVDLFKVRSVGQDS